MSEIKDLLEFAEARAAGKHFELAEDNRWIGFTFHGTSISELETLIENGRVRTKAEVITLYEYKSKECSGDDRILWHESDKYAYGWAIATGRSITGEVKDD